MLPKFLALLALGAAAQGLSPYTLHGKRSQLPSGWSLLRRFDASEVLPLQFGLRQSNLDKLDEFLHDVSHPDSPNYGRHWAPAQIAETFAPSSETVDIVHSWLVGAGIDASRLRVSPSKVWIHLNATVEEAERLLRTQYNVYQHQGGAKHIACEAYHLPGHVSPHVELVSPSIHFDAILQKRGGSSVPARKIGMPGVGISPKTTGTVQDLFTDLENCHKTITPVCLRALYGLVYQPLSGGKNSYGIVEYTPQAYVQSDLDLFNAEFSKDLVGKSPKLVSIAGGVVQTTQRGFNFNGESNLDLQYGMNLVNLVGSKQEVTLYQVGDLTQGASFNNFLDALDGKYCSFEGGDEGSATTFLFQTTRRMLFKIISRNTSLLTRLLSGIRLAFANYAVAVGGKFNLVFGTSASAPVVGAILTMINDARITLGKNPIGFINPVIYSKLFAGAFNDITSGGNQGCGTAGFTSVPGWDPVTGLGTPNFPKLLALWSLLP
ncbi:hypothetical protein GALMADRAFT_278796 [Galerina marginata CBS 339.88]|uniref:Peptidase S53 domain-containing protein n=1 Tax=Galerina marginata (strain CBS 339.88) TaxID=685588 RepID=A0A067TFP9_GALM3|nr:hypothetical protein GALMADRAFT_278796 [Galerina marginata CBS 339.88]